MSPLKSFVARIALKNFCNGWKNSEQDTRYVTALAHNFKGYDSYFVVKHLIERKQKFKATRTGGKLLELTCKGGYIRFIDSMSFFAMALASFTKTFGLDPHNFKKGYFPHLLNTPANANYVSPMPEKKEYAPETTAGEAEFKRWYTAQVGNEAQFDVQRYLVDYCISDVKLLREGCLTFRRGFREQTGFCLFDKLAIAGACLHGYRLNAWRKTPSPPNLSRDGNSSLTTPRLPWNGSFAKNIGCRRKPRFHRQRSQRARNQGEYQIPGRRWRLDGFDETSNTVFEFLGCFWHGCHLCFPQLSRTVPPSRSTLHGWCWTYHHGTSSESSRPGILCHDPLGT